MVQAPKPIHIEPGSELDRLLAAADETDLELEQHGVRYRLTRISPLPADERVQLADERDIWASYDPARLQAVLRQGTGALRDIDRAQLRRDLAEQRGQDSRGRPA